MEKIEPMDHFLKMESLTILGLHRVNHIKLSWE